MKHLFGNLLLIGVVAVVGLWALSELSPAHQPASVAPVHSVVHRISQLDPSQYDTAQEYQTWSGATCSIASMTVVLNSYGRHYRIADVLHEAEAAHAITPDLGLLDEAGIARTVSRLGFSATWGYQRSLDQVIALANQGHPVIVSFPPQPGWPSGHLLAVTGGDQSSVRLADSSKLNLSKLPRSRFLSWWRGFSAIVEEKGGQS